MTPMLTLCQVIFFAASVRLLALQIVGTSFGYLPR